MKTRSALCSVATLAAVLSNASMAHAAGQTSAGNSWFSGFLGWLIGVITGGAGSGAGAANGVPELSAGGAAAGLALVAGCLIVLASRRRRRS